MVEKPDTDRADAVVNDSREGTRTADVKAWFIREVLPLERVLIQFLGRSGRSRSDIEDLRQDVYMRVCAAAHEEIPKQTRALVFTVARNLLIDRARHEQIVSIETVENLDALNIAVDEPAPESTVMAREELRKLQNALGRLPQRMRMAVILQRVEGCSVQEIAARMNTSERTVKRHLSEGIQALAEIMLRETAISRRPS
jgi:RNA polymerase sigma-70 factor (ECF subfamily)